VELLADENKVPTKGMADHVNEGLLNDPLLADKVMVVFAQMEAGLVKLACAFKTLLHEKMKKMRSMIFVFMRYKI
jgi:hypothetical protein